MSQNPALANIQLTAQDEADLKQLKDTLEFRLENSQLKKKLEEQIRKELEAVWEPQLKDYCMGLIKDQAPDQINMEDVTNKLLDYGRKRIPDNIKDDAYKQIKEFLESQDAYKDFINA